MKNRNTAPLIVARLAPRNPCVAAAHARHAGSHRLQRGAQRQQGRRELREQLQRELHTPPTCHRHSP
jgi:hypothetical protein